MTTRKKNHRTGGAQLSRSQISAAVIASLVSTGALAQASVNLVTSQPTADYAVVGHPGNRSHQNNTDAIGASAVDNTVGSAAGGDTQGSSVSISANGVRAAARANLFTGLVDLALADGVGAASGSAQFNTGAVSTAVSANVLGASFDTLTASTAQVLENTISATTTVNASSQTLAGALPVGYVSGSGGLATYSTTGTGTPLSPASVAEGTLVVHGFQRARATADNTASASASAIGNEIALDVDSAASAVTSSSPRLDENAISAGVTNNTATHLIDVQTGGTPVFAGSAVISNDQAASSTAGAISRPATALTAGSAIVATIGADDGVNSLTGTLSVAGNSITSSATSNETAGATSGVAGNRIVLGEGVAFLGAGGGAVASASYASGLDYTAQGSLAISNHQEAWTPLSSTTEAAFVGSFVQSVNGGSVALADNAASARAIGNLNTSEVVADGAASFSGSVALQNSQQNLYLPSGNQNERASVTATLDGAQIVSLTGANGGVTHDSTVGVTGNNSSASAYGNQAGQTLALAANTLDLTGPAVSELTAGSSGNLNASASAALAVSSLQINQQAAVTATATGLLTGLSADSRGDEGVQAPGYNTIVGSTLDVTGNTQQAVAAGNNAGNGISLAVTTLDSGSAGITSAQYQTGAVGAELSDSGIGLLAGTHVAGSELTASDNLQRAVGYGNLSSNSLVIEANEVALGAADVLASQVTYNAVAVGGRAFNTGTQPSVTAVYGVLNDQTVYGGAASVSATAQDSGVALAVEGNLSGSTALTTGNVLLGAAYGNDATSRIAMDVGSSLTASGTGYVPVANVTSTQAVGTGVAISASAGGGEVASTAIERNVVDAIVSASSNAVEALAYGSRAVNSVSASGNEITVAGAGAGATVSAGAPSASQFAVDAAFSVLNAQAGQGSVTASLVDAVGAPTDSATVRVQVGREANSNSVLQATQIDNATVRADSNALLAQAVSNAATNTVATQANTLAAAGALLNAQTTSANVAALVGVEGGTTTIPGSAFTVTVVGSGISGVYDGDTDTWTLNTGGTYSVAAGGLSGAQVLALAAAGYELVSGNYVLDINGGTIISNTLYTALTTGAQTGTRSYTTADTEVTRPNAGGVTLAVTGGASVGVTDSSLSVAGNTTSGLVTGNSATNSVTASGNGVGSGSGLTSASASISGAVIATADHALSNVQSVSSATLSSSVNGTFAIDVTTDADVPVAITGSTLTVNGNAQTARAVANAAVNSVAAEANQLSATSALLSAQSNQAAVSAASHLEVYAPAAVSQSTVTLSDNSNVALGVANDASNRVTVDGGASVGTQGSGIASASTSSGTTSASADHALLNQQASSGTGVSSTAVTALYNQDGVLDATPGLSASSLSVSGNSTIAEASANRATNTLSVGNAASLGASTVVENVQSNASVVNASATASVGVALNGGVLLDAVDGSTVALNGNGTSALARGNAATNVLNAAPGANYGNVLASATLGNTSATAPAVVLNSQSNAAAVNATSTLVSYRVSLNGNADASGIAAIGSTVGVTGNSATAQAYGNSATNALTLSALNTGVAAGGVSNTQSNTASVSAVASSASVGVQLGGGLSNTSLVGSTVRVAGNQLGATAVGNSAVSTIAAR